MNIVPGLFPVLFPVCSQFKSKWIYMFPVFLLYTYVYVEMKEVYRYFILGECWKTVGTTGNWEQVEVWQPELSSRIPGLGSERGLL
jgi:hypothetical protein